MKSFKITAEEKAFILKRRKAVAFPDTYKKKFLRDALEVVEDLQKFSARSGWMLRSTNDGQTYMENSDGFKIMFAPLVLKTKRVWR